MKRNLFVFLFLLLSTPAFLQKDIISGKIQRFFDAMYSADTTTLNSLLYAEATFNTLLINEDLRVFKITNKNDFFNGVFQMRNSRWEEHLHDIHIHVDDMIATAWAPYSFYIGNRLTHCGINIFNFIRLKDNQWVIASLIDTRDNSGACRNDKSSINKMLNEWHQAATNADFDKYFSFFSASAVYLGTDITERWTTNEFSAFAKPYFERGKAWEFTKARRDITMAPFSNNIAWFDEDLNTWMGPCRGSGIAILTDGGWRIQQYVLSVAVPNESIEDYLKILVEGE